VQMQQLGREEPIGLFRVGDTPGPQQAFDQWVQVG
jgi:hypothetical protein